MISLFSRKIFWVLACGLVLAILGSALFFYYSDKVISSKEKEKSLSDKLEEQHQSQANWSSTKLKNEEIQEKQSGAATIRPKADSLDHIMLPSESSEPEPATIIEQTTPDITKDNVLRHHNTKNDLEQIKVAFTEILNSQNIEPMKIIKLVRKSDKKGKDWIRDEIIKRINSDPNPETRRACLVCIVIYRDVAREVLAQALTSDSNRGVQQLAAYGLGQLGTEQEVDVLLQAIKEDKGVFGRGRDIAIAAVSSLGGIGGEKASLALNKIWNDSELSKGCKEVTISALGMSGDTSNFKLLESVLKGEDESIRDNAAFGLGRLARKNQENPQIAGKTIKLLRNYVNDKNPRVRRNVVDAIGWLGGSDDIYLIQPLLSDNYSTIVSYTEDEERKEKIVYPIREEAKEAIEKIKARLVSQAN